MGLTSWLSGNLRGFAWDRTTHPEAGSTSPTQCANAAQVPSRNHETPIRPEHGPLLWGREGASRPGQAKKNARGNARRARRASNQARNQAGKPKKILIRTVNVKYQVLVSSEATRSSKGNTAGAQRWHNGTVAGTQREHNGSTKTSRTWPARPNVLE